MPRRLPLMLPVLVLLIGLTGYAAFGRIEQSRRPDPTGRYVSIISHRPYQYLPIPGLGNGSDSPCFVSIRDAAGKNWGEIPVPMLQLADLQWTATGAEIKLVGEWDFAVGTCFYWSADGGTQRYVKR